MPFQWDPNRNAYVHTSFGKLRQGPNAKKTVIVEQAEKLAKQVASGREVTLGGVALDEHSINEAASRLQDAATLGQELLLVHSQPRQDKKRLRSVVEDIRSTAVLPEDPLPPALQHPLSLFWFVRAPGIEAAELPQWESLELVGVGDEQDLESDVVFDA